MNKPLSIAILGTRGIPNNYGGFEACAQHLANLLVDKGHAVSVYCAHDHPYKENVWHNVELIHKYNPENIIGTAGQFVYDFICNIDTKKRNFDIVLHLGYTSDSVAYKFWASQSKHITNMDGMEWQRSKYSTFIKKFLKKAEALATKRSDVLVADSPAIKEYLDSNYKSDVRYIAYGSEISESYNKSYLQDYNLIAFEYDLVVARLEPENNIEMMIQAKLISKDSYPLIIIGNANKFLQYLKTKYVHNHEIIFLPAIYNSDKLNSIRHYSRYYLHGHSVGGTNPSLLEAMACECRILAHNNTFNSFVLDENSAFFSEADGLANLLECPYRELVSDDVVLLNLNRVKQNYNWDFITSQYENLFYEVYNK